MPTPEEAQHFIQDSGIFWWQRMELAPGVWTPGDDHVDVLLAESQIPADLSGLSVLDIGAANGAVSFELERRGAARVVATDIISGNDFGFERTRDFIGSRAEFLRTSIYELPEVLPDRFDIVVFYGVLYHLRHPLLALDNLHRLTRPGGLVLIDTVVCDSIVESVADQSVCAFFPGTELNEDGSNWFAPTVRCLIGWCESSGFSAEVLSQRPEPHPSRCLVRARPQAGLPPYRQIYYERPIRVVVDDGGG